MIHGPSLLRRDGTGDRWLGGVIAVLCFLASLAAVAAASTDRAAHGWAQALGAEATVQVRTRVGETGPAAAARAAETLGGVRGVAEAEALSRAQAEALLRPWVGEAALADLSIPVLITVRLDPEAPASAATLGRALAQAGLDASVDDHSLWRKEVRAAAARVTWLAVAVFLLTAGGAGAVIVYATRAGLAAQRDVIETLSLNGATDRAIAGLFQIRSAQVAGLGALAGAGGAALLVAGVRWLGGPEGLSAAAPVAWSDLVLLSPGPLIAVTVALVAARVAALRGLSAGLADAPRVDRKAG